MCIRDRWKTFFLFSNTWSTANQGDDSEQMNMVVVFMCSFGMDGGNSSEPLTSHVNSGANDTAPYSYLEKRINFVVAHIISTLTVTHFLRQFGGISDRADLQLFMISYVGGLRNDHIQQCNYVRRKCKC